MLPATFTKEEIDNFAQIDRPGVRLAKDLYAIASENFADIDIDQHGCITGQEIAEFCGNQRLKDFLNEYGHYLADLSFRAKNLADVLLDAEKCIFRRSCSISFADLNTFSWLCEDINRQNFYDGNFQSLREGSGLNGAAVAFLAGIITGWILLVTMLSKLNLFLPPAEAIAFGVIATVGIPLCAAMTGYFMGTTLADKYFNTRVERIDRILALLEQTNSLANPAASCSNTRALQPGQ